MKGLRRVTGLLVLTLVVAGAGTVGSARADFTTDTLISGSTTIEVDYGAEPAISADGDYVAFVGSYLGEQGIWRKNLQTGALDLVALGDANAPSISANGEFISFTTTATTPATGAGAQCPNVWVRDMGPPSASPPVTPQASALTLASAATGRQADGAPIPLTYATNCVGGGSSAAPRVALSADGNEVAFTVDGPSPNLVPGTTPQPAQVAVRYLSTDTTVLVSQTMASIGSSTPEPVPDGAALTDLSGGQDDSAGQQHLFADPDSTAAISADGSTVAWQGIEIPEQAPASSAPAPVGDAPPSNPFDYSEPLWRRIADGGAAPIRRVIGGDDPIGCPGGCAGPLDTTWYDPTALPTPPFKGPQYGDLFAPGGFVASIPIGVASGISLEDATPQLSADGQTVAILSTQPSSGADPQCGVNGCGTQTTNAFVVDMASGLSRDQALTRLTQWATSSFGNDSLAGEIDDLAISPEGDRVAFVTQRVVFPYSPPALITPQLTEVQSEQLYVANLADGTLQVASIGYDGQPANGPVTAPSFSAGGGPIAFASAATNLVYGALSDVPDGFEVFTTTELNPPAIPGQSEISALPPNPLIVPGWLISATIESVRNGTALLSVSVPGAGRVSATATAGVPTRTHTTAARARRPRADRGRRSRRGAGSGERVSRRTIARAATTARGAAVVELRLSPGARYAPLIERARGLYAVVKVTFTAAGRPTLVKSLPVDLRYERPSHRAHRARSLRPDRSAG